uniref:Uncharacterized protein n=1 Tax=Panagrolaimus davidi TaxID=227884 RepID=A0A914QE39_9BILA
METLLNQTSEELEEIEKIEKEKAAKEKDKDAAKKRLDDARKKLDVAKTLLGDAKLLDKLIDDQKAAKESVDEARSQLFDEDVDKSEWTVEQFEEARDEAQTKMDNFEAEAKTTDLKVKEIRTKTAELQKLKEEKLKIGEKALQPAILTKSKKEKEARISECQEEISKCDEQIPDLKKNQRKLKSDFEKANAELESKKSEIATFMNLFTNLSESLNTVTAKLSTYVLDENAQAKLEKEMDNFTERKSELERKKVQYETEKTNVSNKQQKVRVLRDQLTKKTLQSDIATLNGQLMELQEQFEGLAGVEKALRDFNSKYSNTNNQKQTILGQQAPLKDSIKKAQRQLLESNIKNAVENYRDKYSEKCLNEEMSKEFIIP